MCSSKAERFFFRSFLAKPVNSAEKKGIFFVA